MYDYLIVGAGLFGAVCAHELNKKGKKRLLLIEETILQVMHIPKIMMAFRYISMVLIFFIPMIDKYGNM